MNASSFWPLVWKEYRAGRALWLAMAAIALMVQTSTLLRGGVPATRNESMYAIALAIAAGFMAGVGATMFAVEREDRTFGFVRWLPVRPWQLAIPKILCALAGWAALVALLWLAAGALAAWQFPSAHHARQLWTHWGVAALECLGWGVFFSLLLSSPLKAAALTLVAVGLVNFVPIVLFIKIYSGMLESHVAVIPQRLVLLAMVVALDAWLLPRWLTGHGVRSADFGRPVLKAWRGSRAAAWVDSGPSWCRPLAHLIWQTWRELLKSWWAIALVIVGFAIQSVFLDRPQFTVYHPEYMLYALLPIAIYGSLVFHADQLRGPRFLADRGVSPRLVWLSRQIVWAGLLFAIAATPAALMLAYEVLNPAPPTMTLPIRALINGEEGFRRIGPPTLAELALTFYAAGQMASLFVHSGLLAAVAAAALALVMFGWTRSMFAMEIGWWWSVLPLVLSCFAASWLRAPAWLLQRPGWRVWTAPVAALALPLAFVMTGVPMFRVYQVPWVQPIDWTAEMPITPADPTDVVARAKAKRELYDRAEMLDRSIAPQRADQTGDQDRPKVEAQVFDLVLKASQIEGPFWAKDWSDGQETAKSIKNLADAMIDSGKDATAQGNLDEALKLYFTAMRAQVDAARWLGLPQPPNPSTDYPQFLAFRPLVEWAAAPGQKVERIRDALCQLRDFHATLPAMQKLVAPIYEQAPELLAEDHRLAMFPVQRARMERLLNLATREQLQVLGEVDEALAAGRPIGEFVPGYQNPRGPHKPAAPHDELYRTTPSAGGIDAMAAPITLVARFEMDYRATLLVLALEAWKLEKGDLPAKLHDLLDGELSELPDDPLSGDRFRYFPDDLNSSPPELIPFLWYSNWNARRPDDEKCWYTWGAYYHPWGATHRRAYFIP